MSDDNVRQLNQNVTVNLDELERDSKPRFSFVHENVRCEMIDPQEIDFRNLLTIEHPANFLKFALTQETKDLLSEKGMPGWKFNRLIKDYMEYYDLDMQSGKGWLS